MKLPLNLPDNALESIENRPGVYHFYDEDGGLLYVGKSVKLRSRIQSHFRNPANSHKAQKLFMHAAEIKTHETAGDIGAQLLELAHIKNRQPIYNKRSRVKKLLSVAIERVDDAGYKYPEIARVHDFRRIDLSSVLGVYRSNQQAKDIILNQAKDSKLCPAKLQLTTNRNGACFWYQLGRCAGACVGDVAPADFNQQFDELFATQRIRRWPHDGAVTISETTGNRTDHFVIDNWYLKKASAEVDGVEKKFFQDRSRLVGFNYDAYKILSREITKKTVG